MRRVRVSHHRASDALIMDYLWRARKCWLRGEIEDTLRLLGRALHYVQDRCVDIGFLGLRHEEREWEIGELAIPSEEMRKAIRESKCSPRFLKEVLSSVKPKKDIKEALRLACLSSSKIVGAVISLILTGPAMAVLPLVLAYIAIKLDSSNGYRVVVIFAISIYNEHLRGIWL